MQTQPQTTRELIASLRHQVNQAEGGGLSPAQAIAAISNRHKLCPIKVDALLQLPERR
jgi:hypothetical protein